MGVNRPKGLDRLLAQVAARALRLAEESRKLARAAIGAFLHDAGAGSSFAGILLGALTRTGGGSAEPPPVTDEDVSRAFYDFTRASPHAEGVTSDQIRAVCEGDRARVAARRPR